MREVVTMLHPAPFSQKPRISDEVLKELTETTLSELLLLPKKIAEVYQSYLEGNQGTHQEAQDSNC